jgi:hypothetical protein
LNKEKSPFQTKFPNGRIHKSKRFINLLAFFRENCAFLKLHAQDIDLELNPILANAMPDADSLSGN